MNSWGRGVFLAMLPVSLLLIVWAWIGRVFLGSGGWFMLVFMVSVLPVLLICLVVTSVLAFVQSGRPRALTGPQVVAQLVTWAGVFGFGLFIVDFGDTEDSVGSVFSRLLGNGDTVQGVSWTLTFASIIAAVVGWLVLVVLLARGRRAH